MGWLKSLMGIPDAGNIIKNTGRALDSLFTSKDEKMTHAEIMAKIQQNPQEWQAQANSIAATHRSVFVAGARPFIVWVCGIGLANVFIINPWIQWITGLDGPEIPTDALMSLVIAVLGLGGMRSIEKINGAAK